MPSPWAVSLLAAFPALISASTLRYEQQRPLGQFSPIHTQDHSQNYEFDPLLHLPGTSPYFDAVGFGLEHKPPTGCSVTAASYLVRHGAIYANDAEYEKFIKPFLDKFEEHRGQFTDGLEWLNAWRSPIDEDMLEELTPSGANAAEKVGEHIGHRYEHFVNTTKRVLADKKSRCFDTAQNFIRKFPNTNAEEIEVIKLKKPKDGTIDPTIPHKTCNAFEKTPGDEAFKAFVEEYTKHTIARLETAIPSSLKLDPFDIVGMQSICGYESAITGSRSKFCAIFTDAEWMAYEYAWDMKYAYMVGPLNKLSPYLGLPWLKSQAEIFEDISANQSTPGQGWPQDQRLFLYFTHREVPPFVATLLGIFESDDVLRNGKRQQSSWPTDRIVWTRSWKMSDLIPFLGHVGLEKLSCDATSGAIHPDEVAQGVEEKEFVRVIANTAPRPIPGCQKGPGASCPFDRFQHMIGKWDEKFGEYKKICKN